MSRFLNVLRSWLLMVSIIAVGNTVQSFRDHSFLSDKLYTGKPNLVNGLQARTFGIWTLLSSVIRCACAIDIRNKTYLSQCNSPSVTQRGQLESSFPSRSKALLPALPTAHAFTQTRLYHITLWSFVLAVAHFLSEVFIYKTAPMTIGVMAPLMVGSFSVLGMLIGFQYLEVLQEQPVSRNKKTN